VGEEVEDEEAEESEERNEVDELVRRRRRRRGEAETETVRFGSIVVFVGDELGDFGRRRTQGLSMHRVAKPLLQRE